MIQQETNLQWLAIVAIQYHACYHATLIIKFKVSIHSLKLPKGPCNAMGQQKLIVTVAKQLREYPN